MGQWTEMTLRLRTFQGEPFVWAQSSTKCLFIQETSCQNVRCFVQTLDLNLFVLMTRRTHARQGHPPRGRHNLLLLCNRSPELYPAGRTRPDAALGVLHSKKKNRSVNSIHSNHCPWQPLYLITEEKAMQVRAREGDTSLRGKPDTTRPTPRTLRGLSSPRGPWTLPEVTQLWPNVPRHDQCGR